VSKTLKKKEAAKFHLKGMPQVYS